MTKSLNLNIDHWSMVEAHDSPESFPIFNDLISLIDDISNANIYNILCDVEDREYVH